MTRRDSLAIAHGRRGVATRVAVRLGTAAFGLALGSVLWTLASGHPWITLHSGHQVRLLALERSDVHRNPPLSCCSTMKRVCQWRTR